VLAYHRVADPDGDDLVGFRGNVSATPTEFEAHMSWVRERMNPVSLDTVAATLAGGELPERAVLVTFDDGYRDNLISAAPILDRFEIPAVVFLATDHIGTADPFWWDLAAWRFGDHGSGEADLPLLGPRSWADPEALATEWIEAAKLVPDAVRRAAVEQLAAVLGGGDPRPVFAETMLTWDEVRDLARRGWAIGAHTCSHPILTRLDPAVVAKEVGGSVDRVRDEIGRPVLGFAYPNGQPGDFDEIARAAVSTAGVPLAFSLVPGPARSGEVVADPLGIRRVYIHHGDDPTRFGAKVAGIPRLVGRS